jgi:hypothetical protein
MKHAARPPAARTALGIAADGALMIQEVDGLLKHRF